MIAALYNTSNFSVNDDIFVLFEKFQGLPHMLKSDNLRANCLRGRRPIADGPSEAPFSMPVLNFSKLVNMVEFLGLVSS